MKKLFLILMVILLLSSFASAGTLISGSKVAIQSSIFSGADLIGTWSTTPTVNDELYITSNNIEEGTIDSFKIIVEKPEISQIFQITNQQPLQEVTFHSKSFWYTPVLSYSKANIKCEEKINDYLNNDLNGQEFVSGTGALYYAGLGYCKTQFITVSKQVGWFGSLSSKAFEYSQDISIPNKGNLHLERTQSKNDLVDTIPGVARATLLNFGKWTNDELTDKNINAYHEKNDLNSGNWLPIEYTSQLNVYNSAYSNLKSLFQSTPGQTTFMSDSRKTQINSLIQQMSSETNNIRGKQYINPSAWGEIGKISTYGNTISVLHTRPVLIPQIQFVLKGSEFGLILGEGIPSILSYESSVSFEETGWGDLSYKVKNIGVKQGSFVVTAECNTNQLYIEEDDLQLKSNEIVSGKIRISAKTQEFDDSETFTCDLVMRETTTNQEVRKKISIEVITKTLCQQGEQSVPKDAGDKFIVEIYDTQCRVIDQIECAKIGFEFKKKSSGWECVSLTDDGDDGDSQFNLPLLIVTIILGLVGAGFVYFYTPILSKTKTGNVFRWIIVGLTFLAIFFIIPALWKGLIDMFSFGGLI